MKKIIALIVTILLTVSVAANAEGIDLSGMSDEEISVLYNNVLDEMYSRGIARSGELQEGVYRIGVDVAPGSYIISSCDEYYSRYYVFESQELYDQFLELQKSIPVFVNAGQINSSIANESIKVDLREGNILVVSHSIIKLEEVRNRLMP